MYSVGDTTKVFLPGESPWAEVVEVAEGLVKVLILNDLVFDMPREDQAAFTGEAFGTAEPLKRSNDYHKGDELWCEKGQFGEWMPVANEGSA